ncbi:MAG: sugar phosphate isomerase/epimerase family protein [Candidatus Brocadiia bacterium]
MQPRLAFSANAFKRTTFEVAALAVASLGYRGIEVYADTPHFYPLETTPQTASDVVALLKSLGLAVSNVNAFTMFHDGDTWRPSFLETDGTRRRLRIEHTVAALEMSRRMRGATVSTEPGGPLPEGESRETAMALFAEGLREVLDRTAATDVLLLVEPEPSLLIETVGQAEELLEMFADPRLSINLDAGHFFCVGEDPAEVIRRLEGRFDHVHIEDIGADRVHRHLVPGDGAMDFRSIFTALRDVLYDGFITVELYPFEETPEEAARRAIEHLAPIYGEVFGKDPRK